MDELELSIKHMLWKVISKWRFVLICMLCGMLLFGAVGAYMGTRTNSSNTNQQAQTNVKYSERLKALRATLTEQEAQLAENAADYYNVLKKQYEDWWDYKENSVVAKIDFEKVPTMQMMYYVKVGNEDKGTSKGQDIVQAYLMEVHTGDTYSAILKAMEWDIDSEYVRELITTASESDGTMKISIIGESAEDCIAIGQVIQDRIIGLKGRMEETFGSFELVPLEKNFTVCEVEGVVVQQKNRMINMTLCAEGMATAGDKFIGNQRTYYDMLIASFEAQDQPTAQPTPQTGNNSKNIFNVKYIVLGAILGFVVAIGIVILQYMFTSRLRRKEDLEKVYGAPNLGVIRGKQIDAATMEMICISIKAMCTKKNIHTLCLTGTYNSEMAEQVKQQICSTLADELKEIYFTGSIVTEAEALEKVTVAEAVVIVEKEDASVSAEISRQIDLCNMHDVAIIGSVVLY